MTTKAGRHGCWIFCSTLLLVFPPSQLPTGRKPQSCRQANIELFTCLLSWLHDWLQRRDKKGSLIILALSWVRKTSLPSNRMRLVLISQSIILRKQCCCCTTMMPLMGFKSSHFGTKTYLQIKGYNTVLHWITNFCTKNQSFISLIIQYLSPQKKCSKWNTRIIFSK